MIGERNTVTLLIPRGFVHGFLVLSETAVFCYKVDNVYAPQADAGIRWDDPDINIQWPARAIANAKFSEKDIHHPYLKDAEVF
jgi:dTDP-4-dehydrorhamnose 3,5-epimerase